MAAETRVTFRVVAQKADPNAKKIVNTGRGFQTTVIYVLEDGRELVTNERATKKKDLVKSLAKLPVDNVKGLEVELRDGRIYSSLMELIGYNGI